MNTKTLKKNRFLMVLLLLVIIPADVQATESSDSSQNEPLVISNFALMHLTKRLGKLSTTDTRRSSNFFETIYKLKKSPQSLTKEEKRGLSEYIAEETQQLGKALGSSKEDGSEQCMQKTHKELTELLDQIQPQHKPVVLQAVYRPDELLVPADGHCLYTTVILGYLLPVVGSPNDFNQRLDLITNTGILPITHDEFVRHYHDLHYLHCDTGFQQVIRGLLKQIHTQPGTWGGPKEVGLMVEKFNLNIQEYTPDPDQPRQLTKGDLIQPKTWINPPEATLHIVQDTPLKEELVGGDADLQEGQCSSLQTSQHRHHYRLYYSSERPQPRQEEQEKGDNSSELKDDHEENPKQSSKGIHTSSSLNSLPPFPSLENSPSPQSNNKSSLIPLPSLPSLDNPLSPQSNNKPSLIPLPSLGNSLSPQSNNKPNLPDQLKKHYACQNQLPGLLGDKPQPLDDCYIHLAMVTEEDYQVKKQNLLRLEALWRPQSGQSERPRHVVIMGETGMGKSTLSQHLAYRWAKGNLWPGRFVWVLQIPLGKINRLHSNASITDQMAALLEIPGFTGGGLEKLLKQKQPGLLILDGYDKVATSLEKEDRLLGRWLQPCFQNHDHLSVILTTRPGIHCSYLKQPYELRVLGAQQKGINRYVKAYFPPEVPKNKAPIPPTSEKAKALLEVMRQNPTLKSFSHTPLSLRLLCILAKQQGLKSLGKSSIPELYQQIITQFLYHNLTCHNKKVLTEKENTIFKTYGLALTYLGQLAFEGIRRGQTVLPVKLQVRLLERQKKTYPNRHRRESEYWACIVGLGLLQGYTSSSLAPTTATYFPHLTIQEWLAARYLTTALYGKQHRDHKTAMALINEDKYAPRYQVILPFIAGRCYQHIFDQTDPKGKGLTIFWKLLEARPRELTGIHHAMLVARCLEACKADTSSQIPDRLQKRHKGLIVRVAVWLAAFIDQKVNLREVSYYDQGFFLPLRRPIIGGLQGCCRLFHHPLIINHIKSSWVSLSLEGNEEAENTKRWHVRLVKMKTLASLPLSNQTAKQLQDCLQQALQYKAPRVRSAAVAVLPSLLPALQHNEREVSLKLFKKAFDDSHWRVRNAALKTLRSLLPVLKLQEMGTLVKPVRKALDDSHWKVRDAAVAALPSLLDVLKPQQITTLVKWVEEALANNDWRVREIALEALPSLLYVLAPQDALKWLEKALTHNNYKVQEVVLNALPSLFHTLKSQDALEWLEKPLMHNNHKIQEVVLDALPSLFHALKPQDALQWIEKALTHKSYEVRYPALKVLPLLIQRLQRQDIAILIKPIQKALDDNDWLVRDAVRKALPSLLEVLAPQDALKWIKNALDHNNKYVRSGAINVLPSLIQRLQPQEVATLVKPIQKALDDNHWPVRYAVQNALPSLLKALPLEDALEWIKNALAHNKYEVRKASVKALPPLLQTLQPEEALEWLKKVLNDNDWRVRDTVRKALPELLQALKPQDNFKWIKKALADDNYEIRYAALKALPSLLQALEPKDALRWIKKALTHNNKYVRADALKVLPSLLKKLHQHEMATLVKPVQRSLDDNHWSVRYAAKKALPRLLRPLQFENNLEWFRISLADKEYEVRYAAITELPSLLQGLKSKEALKWIEKALDDNNHEIRDAVLRALPSLLCTLKPKEALKWLKWFKKALVDYDNHEVQDAVRKALPSLLQAIKPQEAFKWLKKALNDNNHEVRCAAHKTLLATADEAWKDGLQHQLEIQRSFLNRLFGTDLENLAYLLLQASPLVCFSKEEKNDLPSYKFFVQMLNKQATTWGWPIVMPNKKKLSFIAV